MQQEVKYEGYSAVPSGYECADGQLSMALGVVPEDGALKPVLPPKVLFTLEENQKVVFIHKTSIFKHYIVFDSSTNELLFTDGNTENGLSLQLIRKFDKPVQKLEAVGNVLIALTSDGIHYLLWKNTSQEYLYLGSKLPEISISFGLQGSMLRSDTKEILFKEQFNMSQGSANQDFYGEENVKYINEQLLAQVNEFLQEKVTGENKFLFPFFVRWCYVLFDGSETMHSAPILMIPSTWQAPLSYGSFKDDNTIQTSINNFVSGLVCDIDYQLLSDSGALDGFSDIIKGIDVFVSAPIWTYKQSGSTNAHIGGGTDSFYVAKNQGSDYQKGSYENGTGIQLPYYGKSEISQKIKDVANFYFLKHISVEELKESAAERKVLKVSEEGCLSSLLTRRTMSDDYRTHDAIKASNAFSYNGRLHLSGVQTLPFQGFPLSAMTTFRNDGDAVNYSVTVVIEEEGTVQARTSLHQLQSDSLGYYFFYPNVNAKRMFVIGGGKVADLKLTPHDFLEGAYCFSDFEEIEFNGYQDDAPAYGASWIPRLNRLYSSEVNNPFFFPVTGINAVGTGDILSVSAVVRALSQGQFGQFPLYAFTTEGVWALTVADDGTFKSVQPVTRDVCINPDSITQIDTAVLFASDRGIMLISGSDTVCVSDSINSVDLFSLADLPQSGKIIDVFNKRAGEDGQLSADDVGLLPFRDFLEGCRMVYDYVNRRIFVYNPDAAYAYVYSLKSKGWGMARNSIVRGVNSYPEALAMLSDGSFVDVSSSDAASVASLVVTRPLKLGYPDILKTIDTVIQRGYFQRGHIAQVLYGSNDLFNWHTVWSSTDKYLRGFRGSSYKYFRLVLLCRLDKAESIYGFTVRFNQRMNDQPR